MTVRQRETETSIRPGLPFHDNPQLFFSEHELLRFSPVYAQYIRPRPEIAPPFFDPVIYDRLESIAQQIEAEMPEVLSHGFEVSEAGVCMMRRIGCSPVEIEKARIGLLLHDVGKLGEKELIRSGKQFTRPERERVHAHPILGEAFLHDLGLPIEIIDQISDPMLFHHENYGLTQMPHWLGFENEHDTGYPFKIHGKDIPLSARVARYVDIYCGLRKERPYKKSWSMEESINYVEKNLEGIFDPDLYYAFLASIPEIEAMLMRTSAEQQVPIKIA